MKKYLLSIYQPGGSMPPPEILESIMRDVAALNEELQAAGVFVFTAGLEPSGRATVVRARDGKVQVTDGPFIESKEHVGGFWVIQVADDAEARDWAARAARATTLPIEVRAFQDARPAQG